LNASGRSPYDWSLEAARELGLDRIPQGGPLSWSVPGCVSGWGALIERFGTRSLGELLAAPIRYAREGFVVSPLIARAWGFDIEKWPTLAPAFAAGGKPSAFGDVFRNPDLAECFEVLVRDGARAFYEGEIAERIVRFSVEQGGRFSLKDFAEHACEWVEPATSSYRGCDVWELPPNGQGIAALQILNILEHFDVAALTPNSAEHLHLFIEAKKLAYEDRAVYYADMDVAEVPVEWLISKEYAAARAKLIDPERAAADVQPGEAPVGSETVYLTTADGAGNMVSLIQSTYNAWGSRMAPPGLGFPIQNRGAGFALDPGHRNRLEPHKRPFHTIIPGFVTRRGAPLFSFGVMGGDHQPQGHAQVLMNLLDFGMSPQQAGEQPRVHHGGSSTPEGRRMQGAGDIHFEHGTPDAVKVKLASMGHGIGKIESWGGYQGIWREDAPLRYYGGSDPRKDGCAAGY
jgi:gamma-glutamyltranspeptidase/glutathione hydrolase